ncbi:MAG: RNA polymerase sigma factor [Planctomycetaceae bacterium]|nr:RNA polymerase sigma factor [Planctomycetaceae bacterium]
MNVSRLPPRLEDTADDRADETLILDDRVIGGGVAWSDEVDRIYRTYSPELWAAFYAKCADPEIASDALQEAFARFLEQGERTIRHPVSWLRQVGTNWLYDRFRRGLTERPARCTPGVLATERFEPSALLMKIETTDRVRGALRKLGEVDRHVLVLRYALNWPSRKIGLAVNLAPEAIDMRMSRARRALAAILQSSGR